MVLLGKQLDYFIYKVLDYTKITTKSFNNQHLFPEYTCARDMHFGIECPKSQMPIFSAPKIQCQNLLGAALECLNKSIMGALV